LKIAVTDFRFYQVDIFDVEAGSIRRFFSDIDKVKELPVAFERDDCLPAKIEVRTFIFDENTYQSVTDMICGALNRQTLKMPKKILTWSTENGWLSI
jgi:hypothetical protein